MNLLFVLAWPGSGFDTMKMVRHFPLSVPQALTKIEHSSCRDCSSDGATSLIVAGIAGSVLDTVIAPGDSKTLGALLGAGVGAMIGRSIDRNNVTR
jgi:hypothetical protein